MRPLVCSFFGLLSALFAASVFGDASHEDFMPKKLVLSFGCRPCIADGIQLRGKTLVQTWEDRWSGQAKTRRKARTAQTVPTKSQWLEFRRSLDEINVWGWRSEYNDPRVMDGESWSLVIEYSDRAVASHGVNAYPEAFNRYRAAIHKLAGPMLFGQRRSELEFYDIDQLQLIATGGANKHGRAWGDFRDRKGYVHRARVGAYIGLDHGRIVEITDTTVKTSELAQDANGDWIERIKIVRIARSPGFSPPVPGSGQ